LIFSPVRTSRYAKDRLVLDFIVLLDWLAVQPRAYSKRKYYLGGSFGESEGFVIVNKSNDIGDYAEYKVVIYKEGISFPALKLVSPNNRKGVLIYGRFRFCYNLVFFKQS